MNKKNIYLLAFLLVGLIAIMFLLDSEDTPSYKSSKSVAKENSDFQKPKQEQESKSENDSANDSRTNSRDSYSSSNKNSTSRALRYLQQFNEKWKSVEGADGEVFKFVGGTTNAFSDENEVRAFFVGFSSQYNIAQTQVRDLKSSSVNGIDYFDIYQYHQDLPVYDSWARLFVNQNTAEGFMINSYLKEITQPIDKSIDLTMAQIELILSKKYGNNEFEIHSVSALTVWGGENPQVGKVILLNRQQVEYEVFIGFKDQEVLSEKRISFE